LIKLSLYYARFCKDANIVFATGAGGIFRSTNRGITWAKIGAGLESYSTQRVFIHSATPNLMFATVNPVPDAPLGLPQR